MMRYLFLLIPALVLSACAPTFHQIVRYEKVGILQQDTLYVPYNNKEEEIALLEKYNRNRKANRISKRVNRNNEDLMAAFHIYYNFSPVVFWDMEANDYQYPNGFYTYETIFEEYTENGNNTQLSFQIKDAYHKTLTSVDRDFNAHRIGYKWYIRDLNRKLYRLQRQGAKVRNQ